MDDPREYDVWYLTTEPSTAVGEVCADLAIWSATMFPFPALAGSIRALGVYDLADDLPVLDLDGSRRWAGVRWWPYHRPQWNVLGVWGAEPRSVEVQVLDLGHIAVQDAARTLAEPI